MATAFKLQESRQPQPDRSRIIRKSDRAAKLSLGFDNLPHLAATILRCTPQETVPSHAVYAVVLGSLPWVSANIQTWNNMFSKTVESAEVASLVAKLRSGERIDGNSLERKAWWEKSRGVFGPEFSHAIDTVLSERLSAEPDA